MRKAQITLEPEPAFPMAECWSRVNHVVRTIGAPCKKVLTSSHSIDILAPGVSKPEVVRRLREILTDSPSNPILCIGDRGGWPGNDFELLAQPYSLSVDEISADPDTCWNIAPIGIKGVQATQYYLSCMDPSEKAFAFRLSAVRRRAE